MGIILLFYKYIGIKHPNAIIKWQKKLCNDLQLTGRILVAKEGINGTLAGSTDAVGHYKDIMNKHELFSNIDFKESPGTASAFPRLKVVQRDEIVHLGIPADQLTVESGGMHLTPADAHTLLNTAPDDLVVIDCRNNYESDIGTMPQAICPPTRYFREFPAYIQQCKDQFKNKQVLMYCTGGVRCERASAYVKQATNARKVYQIEGGIHRYVEQFPNGHFRGKNYVFDGRVSVRVNDDVLGSCYVCQQPCDEYTNCCKATCNRHFICCQICNQKLENLKRIKIK